MKEFLTKYKKLLVIFVFIGVLLIPLLINCLFKLYSPIEFFTAEWKAGEFLSFYGEILGAAATIIAIVLTIDFTVTNQKEQRRLAQKPYLHSSYLPLYGLPEVENNCKNILYISIERGLISSSMNPPFIYSQAYKVTGDKIKDINLPLNFSRSNHVLEYLLSNVGAGNAINMSFTINGSPFIPQFAIPVNSTKTLIFLLKDDLLVDNECKIKLEITYWDVASIAKYSQSETIRFYRDIDDSLSTSQRIEWLLSSPIRTEETEAEKLIDK